MKKFVVGVVFGLCLPFIAAFLFVRLGGMPVATKSPPLPMERYLAGVALHAAIEKEAGKPSPLPANEANLLAGARVYQMQCEDCHGALDKPETAIARGMFPHPPQMLPPKKGVTDDPVGVTYWKVRNGIRLTGMPGFGESLTDKQLWQVSLLLLHAHDLPASAKKVLHE